MKRAMAGLVTAVLMVALAACGREPASVVNDNAELDALTMRMYSLQEKVASAGAMTPQLKGELAVLVSDVEAWQKRTSRTDIAVKTSSPTDDATMGTSALIRNPGSGCTPCPLVKAFGDQVCFLTYEGPCANGMIAKVCVYTCLTRTRSFSTTALPAKIADS